MQLFKNELRDTVLGKDVPREERAKDGRVCWEVRIYIFFLLLDLKLSSCFQARTRSGRSGQVSLAVAIWWCPGLQDPQAA